MMVVIKGLNKTTLVDYPPYVACTVFLSACNFRCGFCHNPNLVLRPHLEEDITTKEVIEYVKSKKKWLDAVVITGGEPTLHDDLVEFVKKLKELDVKVKLDTNGSRPKMIKELIDSKLVDKISMDIKTSEEKYHLACRCEVDTALIEESISLLKSSGIDHEFRCTVVPGIVDEEDIVKISRWLGKSKNFYIQQFRSSEDMIDNSFKDIKPYDKETLEKMKASVKDNFDKIEVRNL